MTFVSKEILQQKSFHTYFDSKLFKDFLKITDIDVPSGKLKCQFELSHYHANGFGSLHGGVICSLVDIVGTLAIIAVQNIEKGFPKPGVSTDLNVSFTSGHPIRENDTSKNTIHIEASVLKMGKMLAFVEVNLFKDNTNKSLIAQGRMTKALLAPSSSPLPSQPKPKEQSTKVNAKL